MLKKDVLKLAGLDKKLDKAVSNLGDYPFHNSVSIYINHTLENVRTNGWQKLNSWPEINEEFQKVLRDYERVVKWLPEIKKLIDAFQSEMDRYIICPVCKGTHGKQTLNDRHTRSTWEDCENCYGTGAILKENNKCLQQNT